MPIDPSCFLEQAERLLSSDETDNRTAVSRAYYAGYHACQSYYKTLVPEDSAQSGMHRQFLDGLINSPNKTDKSIGYRLQEIYKGRIKADYKLTQRFPSEDAKSHVAVAGQVLEQLKTLSK